MKKKSPKENLLAEDKEILKMSHKMGQKLGHAQAFGAMKILAEYLECKALQEIIDSGETLKRLGFFTVDAYFDSIGISRSEGYRKRQIARNLTPDDVSFLGQTGLHRKDLLPFASLSDEQRLEIKEGKVINLEKANPDEIRHVIEEMVDEKKSLTQKTERLEGFLQISNKRLKEKAAEADKWESMIAHPENSKWVEKEFVKIGELYREMDNRISAIAFDHRIVDNQPLQDAIELLHEQVSKRAIIFTAKFKKFIGGDE